MIKIAICDDNPIVVEYYKALILDSAKENDVDVKLRNLSARRAAAFYSF